MAFMAYHVFSIPERKKKIKIKKLKKKTKQKKTKTKKQTGKKKTNKQTTIINKNKIAYNLRPIVWSI